MDNDYENIVNRFKAFKIDVLDSNKNKLPSNEVPDYGFVIIPEKYEYEELNEIDELIDYCIDNRRNTVIVSPVIYNHQEVMDYLLEDDYETDLYESFENEFKRLSKVHSGIDIENYMYLYEDAATRLRKDLAVTLNYLYAFDGKQIGYRFNAYVFNICKRYTVIDTEKPNSLYSVYSVLADITEELILKLDMCVSDVFVN